MGGSGWIRHAFCCLRVLAPSDWLTHGITDIYGSLLFGWGEKTGLHPSPLSAMVYLSTAKLPHRSFDDVLTAVGIEVGLALNATVAQD
jgi:hypothetical protein